MATLTVYGDSGCGRLEYGGGVGVSYATCQGAASATITDQDPTSATGMRVGQQGGDDGNAYAVARAVVSFDLSALPINAVISAAVLSLYGKVGSDGNDSEFNIVVVSAKNIGTTLVAADYGELLDETTSMGSFTCTTAGSFVSTGYNVIALNAIGIADIVRGGITRFALRSNRDISVTTPKINGNYYIEDVTFWGNNKTDQEPKLTIAYASGEGSGVIAIVEERFHYIDAYGNERYIEGTLVS